MKSKYYILASLILLAGLTVLYLQNKEEEKVEVPDLNFLEYNENGDWYLNHETIKTSDLIIVTDKDLEPFYYFHLDCKYYSYPKSHFDTIKNMYIFKFSEVPEGKITMSLVSEFNESFDTTFLHNKVDTVIVLGFNYKKYNKKTKVNQVITALKNNLPMKLLISNNDSEAKVCYQFNKLDNHSIIYKWKHGVVTDSMEIDYATFKSKLRKLISMNENPSRRNKKSYINEKGEEIREVTFTTSAHYNTIYIQIENNIYCISGSTFDMEGKQYEFFQEFCRSFYQPQFQMKI